MNVFQWLHDKISEISFTASIIALAVIVLISFTGTMARYFFASPIGWVFDITGYLLVASVFFAAPEVSRSGQHVGVEFLQSSIHSDIGQRLLSIIINILTFGTLSVMTWVVLDSAISTFRTGSVTAAGYPIPRWWLFACIVYGLGSSALYFLRFGVQAILHGNVAFVAKQEEA